MVLVKSSTAHPLTSLFHSATLYIVLIHIQAGCDLVQCYTPYANTLRKLKACLNIWNALFQISLLPNLLYFNIWKPEVFL